MNPIRRCRDPECRAEIRFEKTHAGATIPIDAFPVAPEHRVLKRPVKHGYVYDGGIVRPHQADEGPCFMSHVVTCHANH